MYSTYSRVHPYLKVLILLLRQTLFGYHQCSQTLSGHVPTLRERKERRWKTDMHTVNFSGEFSHFNFGYNNQIIKLICFLYDESKYRTDHLFFQSSCCLSTLCTVQSIEAYCYQHQNKSIVNNIACGEIQRTQ